MNPLKTPTLTGTIRPASDKSMTHRALILGALTLGETIILNPLASDDINQTIQALEQLGITITRDDEHACIKVQGLGRRGIQAYVATLATTLAFDFGNSGTTTRLMIGLLAGLNISAHITGDRSLQRRPMARVVDPLVRLGAQITLTDGHLPLTINQGITATVIDTELQVGSAQVKTALLLAGLGADIPVTVTDSFQTRNHTELMLQAFGVPVTTNGPRIHIPAPVTLRPQLINIPGDISSAAFWLVAGSIIPASELTVAHVGVNPTRTGILAVLDRMQSQVTLTHQHVVHGEAVADINIRYTSNLKATTISANEIPQLVDELPIIALLATQATGVTYITGAQELRFKESNRLRAVGQVLQQFGAAIQVNDDGFTISGPTSLQVPTGVVDDFGDHRITMLSLIAHLMTGTPHQTLDVSNVNISYPHFIDDLEELLND